MNRNVKAIPFPDIENAYVVISGVKSDKGNYCEKRMSFFYAGDNSGSEWEPDYGPITRITPCGKNDGSAKEHWFYDYYTGNGDWTQCAVDEENLPKKFLAGNYKGLFDVLKKWCDK